MGKIVFVPFKKGKVETLSAHKRKEAKEKVRKGKKQDTSLEKYLSKFRKKHVKKIFHPSMKMTVAMLLLIGVAITTYVVSNDEHQQDILSLRVVSENHNYTIAEYKQDKPNAMVSVYYPITSYEALNKEILKRIDLIIKDAENGYYYNITGNFEYYDYQDIISVVFTLSQDFKGAHPLPIIYTINYDTKTNQFVTIDTLVQKKQNLLQTLSSYSLEHFKKDPKFKEIKDVEYMLIDGTKPVKENFQNFIVKQEGLEFIFSPYQIAPYYFGATRLVIPNDVLMIK